jgi:alkanesulfonate monooxygenase
MRRFVTLNHLFSGLTNSTDIYDALRRCGPGFLREAEAGGIDGVLIFVANRMPNPFAVAHMVVSETKALIPLIALRAELAHPFEVYSRLLALSELGRRPIAVNLVAGSNQSEHVELGDLSQHDERYQRLHEFATVLTCLAETGGVCCFSGHYYRVDTKVRMIEPSRLDLRVYVSGSSTQARTLSRAHEALRIAPWEIDGERNELHGVPLGIIARDSDAAAWQAADFAFPTHRDKVMIPELAGNDSQWRAHLTRFATEHVRSSENERPLWWYEPYRGTRLHRNGRRSNHVWLVGSYARVAGEIAALARAGVSDLVLYQEHADETVHLLKATAHSQFGSG